MVGMKRSIHTAAWVLACALLLALSSPVLAAGKGSEIKLDSPPAASKALRIAVLPTANHTSEVDAVKIFEDIFSERVKEMDKAKAIFLLPADVERILASRDAVDLAYRITDVWAKRGSLDSTAIGGLDSLLVVDAVMCVKISEWETKRFHNVGEGQSYTTVGFSFALFGIRDRKPMWSKEVREQRLAPEIDLSSGAYTYDATGRLQSPSANEPPRAQDVASDLIRSAFKKFPAK